MYAAAARGGPWHILSGRHMYVTGNVRPSNPRGTGPSTRHPTPASFLFSNSLPLPLCPPRLYPHPTLHHTAPPHPTPRYVTPPPTKARASMVATEGCKHSRHLSMQYYVYSLRCPRSGQPVISADLGAKGDSRWTWSGKLARLRRLQ